MTFATLALVVAVGLLGPMLALAPTRFAPPLVVGEVAAGVLVGYTGLRRLDPNQPGIAFLADIGFAILMFIVGTHVPVRDARLRGATSRGAVAVAVMAVLSLAAAPLVAAATGFHKPLLLALLIGGCSAAIVLPICQSTHPTEQLLVTMAWVAFADVATIIAVPFVLASGGVLRAIEGVTLVIIGAVAVGLIAARFSTIEPVGNLRRASHARGWALDLRVSLLVLFGLAAIAEYFDTSVLIAGFAAGVMVAALGEPRRVTDQLIGLGEGFFVPLFFVVLGARLDLRSLVHSSEDIRLFVLLVVASTAVPVLVAMIVRLRPAHGLLAAARLGVPAAVATIGLNSGVLRPSQAAAIVAAAVVSLGVATAGAALVGVTPSRD